jgi:hypothetical protein
MSTGVYDPGQSGHWDEYGGFLPQGDVANDMNTGGLLTQDDLATDVNNGGLLPEAEVATDIHMVLRLRIHIVLCCPMCLHGTVLHKAGREISLAND